MKPTPAERRSAHEKRDEAGRGCDADAEAERRYRFGWRLTPGGNAGAFQLSVEASRRETANDNEPEHGAGVRLTARW